MDEIILIKKEIAELEERIKTYEEDEGFYDVEIIDINMYDEFDELKIKLKKLENVN